jgi:hypothetical protein
MRTAIQIPFCTSFFGVLLSIVLADCPALGAGQETAPPVQQGKGHHFACTDYTQGKVFIVSPEGVAEWEYPAPHCNDLWVLPNGNLLFNTGHGVKEVTRDKEVVWTFSDHKTMKTVSSIHLLNVPGWRDTSLKIS